MPQDSRVKRTSEVETTNVEEVSVLSEAPDLGLLQVVEAIVVGGTEVSAKTAVVAGDDGSTAASLLLGVDAVLDAQASGFDGIVQNSGVLVVTDAAEVDDAVGGENVLGTTGAVLGGTASNQLSLVVVEELLVDGDVLLLGQDGIVVLEGVLVEQLLVANGLDICKFVRIKVSEGDPAIA